MKLIKRAEVVLLTWNEDSQHYLCMIEVAIKRERKKEKEWRKKLEQFYLIKLARKCTKFAQEVYFFPIVLFVYLTLVKSKDFILTVLVIKLFEIIFQRVHC